MEEDREVSTQEGIDFAEFYQIKFVETSAKTLYNVETAFSTLSRDIYDKVESREFRLEDGWDGVKIGCSSPKRNVQTSQHVLEAQIEKNACC